MGFRQLPRIASCPSSGFFCALRSSKSKQASRKAWVIADRPGTLSLLPWARFLCRDALARSLHLGRSERGAGHQAVSSCQGSDDPAAAESDSFRVETCHPLHCASQRRIHPNGNEPRKPRVSPPGGYVAIACRLRKGTTRSLTTAYVLRGDHECANDIECYKPLEFAKQLHFEACSPKRRWQSRVHGADLLKKKNNGIRKLARATRSPGAVGRLPTVWAVTRAALVDHRPCIEIRGMPFRGVSSWSTVAARTRHQR